MSDGEWEGNGDAQEVGNQPHDAVMDMSGEGDVPTPSHTDNADDVPADIANQHHDAAIELDSRPVKTPERVRNGSAGGGAPAGGSVTSAAGDVKNKPHDHVVDLGSPGHVSTPPGRGGNRPAGSPNALSQAGSTPQARADPTAGDYDPTRYSNLDCDAEVKEMFTYITAFAPTRIELEVPLKPFLPEYVAAVGEMDVFVKVPRPDGKADNLGLVALDEPSARQSSPPIVWIELTYMETASTVSPYVQSVEDAIKRPLVVDNWIKSVDDIHRNAKPSTSIAYSKPMPSADALLEVWPPDFEEALSKSDTIVPPGDLDVDLLDYTKICCALVDIPVYSKPIESLHAFFTLYADFKQNVHFQANAYGGE